MPGLIRSSSSSSRSSYEDANTPGTDPSSASSSEAGDDYPALSFPGYAEKPLDEQLEPIAVIGMGESKRIL